MHVNCGKVLDYVERHRLHKPMVIFDFQKEIMAEHEYVCMLSLNHLQTQSPKDQRDFANQFFQHYIARHWWDSYEPYFLGMLEVFQTLGLVQSNSRKTYRKCKKLMVASERPEKHTDLLDTEKAQDMLNKLRQDCPDLHDSVRQGVARMWAAGCIPEESKKPLTGSEKRKLKAMMPIDSKSLPKPKELPPQDYHGLIEISDKAREQSMLHWMQNPPARYSTWSMTTLPRRGRKSSASQIPARMQAHKYSPWILALLS